MKLPSIPKLEADIDKQLLERIYIRSPGGFVFISTNMLVLFGVATLTIVAIGLFFSDRTESGSMFMFLSSIAWGIIVVTPPFLLAWGYRWAYPYFYSLVAILLCVSLLFITISTIKNGATNSLNGFSMASTAFFAIALYLIRTPTYTLFCIFSARRRERSGDIRKASEKLKRESQKTKKKK